MCLTSASSARDDRREEGNVTSERSRARHHRRSSMNPTARQRANAPSEGTSVDDPPATVPAPKDTARALARREPTTLDDISTKGALTGSRRDKWKGCRCR